MAMKHNYAPPTINIETLMPGAIWTMLPTLARNGIDTALCNC